MRIAMFTEVFLPKIDGVVTRVLRTLDELSEMGHEVLVFAPGDPPPYYAGFEVVRVRSLPFRPVYPEVRVGLPTPRIAERMVDFRPDVVHAVNPVWLAAYGVLSAEHRDRPLLASYHTQVASYTRKMHLGWLEGTAQRWTRSLHNRAEVNLCTSPQMVDAAIAAGVKRVDLWPKAVDTKTYRPDARTDRMRRRLTDDHPDMPLAIYVGRMSNEKGIDDLLEPVHRLRGVRFAFVGSGPARERLQHAFAGTNTVFTGYLTGHELAEAYASADMFVFPSTTETLGFAGLEAMASGVPVIGARAGGIPHLFDDGVEGILFTPHDADEIMAAISRLVDDEPLRRRMGEAARIATNKYTWRASTEALVGFYELAIDRHEACRRRRPGTRG
ncbi:glycosyltransferase family 1 protein [Brooklawnia cerclae]|uniref:Glycosyltransferase involved in cell wall biosynthesis n=1 Tax=Brooklawnia cerclae TaxID=349934 RepID=A0ABX0SEJ5_9ACTN|nr:glycosyltransferase [Brooklawnia cerclae]NIH56818.1 glycosyltransferase involved in cell wall biosynthesis [Brooklawnia cerclae]